jgi:hypothetical protein
MGRLQAEHNDFLRTGGHKEESRDQIGNAQLMSAPSARRAQQVCPSHSREGSGRLARVDGIKE